jgi:hypothetical protein
MDDIICNTIKAMTAFGGDCLDYADYYTDGNLVQLNKWLKAQPKVRDITLFRGYTFGEGYYNDADFREGAIVGIDALTQASFPSFTADFLRAVNYISEFGEIGLENVVRVLFSVKTTGRAFADISNYSYYKDEQEYKCPLTAKFKVIAIKEKTNYTLIELQEL